ncbi:MAG: universal stress protein [Chloroflexi bacterium]|nr:universal stress protein [Chloroflexota bacterium]
MFKRILVCLDGSSLAEQILPYVTEQAKQFNSKVVLLQVITRSDAIIASMTATGDPLMMSSQVSFEKIESESEETKAYLSRIAKQMEDAGLDVEHVAIFDPLPGPAIVDHASENKVDLIAIATHGRSGLRRAISGSVADHVIRESHLPILLIRPRE